MPSAKQGTGTLSVAATDRNTPFTINVGAMGPPRLIHRNITFERLLRDACQFIRTQRPVTRLLGRPFGISRRFVEIDITYRCNLRCANCNRSCTQAPCDLEMPLDTIAAFIDESLAAGIYWERVRLLGGEPTLHRRFFAIIARLEAYRRRHNPGMRIVLCTNGTGARVRQALAKLPASVTVKNTYKKSLRPLFRPFNRAPVDSPWHRFSDFAGGCRILADCGLGLTPLGYYACAVAGGIDRVFGIGLGRRHLPEAGDDLRDQLAAFCPVCGHFGFAWPTRQTKISAVWVQAYQRYQARLAHEFADSAAGASPGNCIGERMQTGPR